MATTVRSRRSTRAEDEAPEGGEAVETLTTKVDESLPKHSDFAAELDLEHPFDGIQKLRFRRVKLSDMRNIFGHSKFSAQLGRFIMDKAHPQLSKEQIESRLDSVDATCIADVMNWLMGGYTSEDDADESIWDDVTRPLRGNWNESANILTLGYPLYTREAKSGRDIAIRQFKFKTTVPFGRTGALQQDDGSPNSWVTQIQEFLRVFGEVVSPDLDFKIPMTHSLTDQLDATDALMIMMEVQPSIMGKRERKSRFRPL